MKKIISFFLISTFVIFSSCSEDKPTEPTNNAPKIQSITASPSPIKVNETTSLTCVATDSDGDNLTYSWSSDNGTFPNGTSGSSTTWRAPSGEGTFNIKVIVSDGKETDQKEKNITVSANGCVPTVTYSGKTYNTVQIGDQCWLKENLDVGTMVSSNSSGDNQTDNGTIEKYCYDNDSSNCEIYGGFYQWNEAMQYVTTEGTQGICPTGWHIPTKADFAALQTHANNEVAKLVDQSQTTDGYTPTNETGFSALFAGLRYSGDGSFHNLGFGTFFWSSTKNDSTASGLHLKYNRSDFYLSSSSYVYGGKSVRCLKD